MRWGVTYAALLCNLVVTMEAFLLARDLLALLLCIPIHAACVLLCARDPRFFDLLMLWCRTRAPALLVSYGYWKTAAYAPLVFDPPDLRGRRRGYWQGRHE
jgi:type IV secretion system protein VirB3